MKPGQVRAELTAEDPIEPAGLSSDYGLGHRSPASHIVHAIHLPGLQLHHLSLLLLLGLLGLHEFLVGGVRLPLNHHQQGGEVPGRDNRGLRWHLNLLQGF